MNLIELNFDAVLRLVRKRLVRTASEKCEKGYYLNVRIYLNQFKITATGLKKAEVEYDPDENEVPRRCKRGW